MRIHRAHSYDPIERIRADLARVPDHWRRAADPWKFIVLPDDLKPSWIGLSLRTDKELHAAGEASVGDRTFDDMGGWTATPGERKGEGHDYWVRDTPHIFLNHSSVDSAVHEMGHALEHVWRAPVEALYEPEAAWSEYMALNPSEFFAVGLAAFLREDRNDRYWNRLDLAERAPDLHDYLTARARDNTYTFRL